MTEKRTGGVSRGGHSKVPAVTLGFWIIKIAATTLGETGGDAVSMSLNLGYAVSSIFFIALFVVAVAAQIAAHQGMSCQVPHGAELASRKARIVAEPLERGFGVTLGNSLRRVLPSPAKGRF